MVPCTYNRSHLTRVQSWYRARLALAAACWGKTLHLSKEMSHIKIEMWRTCCKLWHNLSLFAITVRLSISWQLYHTVPWVMAQDECTYMNYVCPLYVQYENSMYLTHMRPICLGQCGICPMVRKYEVVSYKLVWRLTLFLSFQRSPRRGQSMQVIWRRSYTTRRAWLLRFLWRAWTPSLDTLRQPPSRPYNELLYHVVYWLN